MEPWPDRCPALHGPACQGAREKNRSEDVVGGIRNKPELGNSEIRKATPTSYRQHGIWEPPTLSSCLHCLQGSPGCIPCLLRKGSRGQAWSFELMALCVCPTSWPDTVTGVAMTQGLGVNVIPAAQGKSGLQSCLQLLPSSLSSSPYPTALAKGSMSLIHPEPNSLVSTMPAVCYRWGPGGRPGCCSSCVIVGQCVICHCIVCCRVSTSAHRFLLCHICFCLCSFLPR